MDRARAEERFDEMTAPAAVPRLDADDVSRFLLRARVVDEAGRWPAEAQYVETFTEESLRRQAADAWRTKMGRAANGAIPVKDGDTTIDRTKLVDACEKMVKLYTGDAGIGSISVGAGDPVPRAAILNG